MFPLSEAVYFSRDQCLVLSHTLAAWIGYVHKCVSLISDTISLQFSFTVANIPPEFAWYKLSTCVKSLPPPSTDKGLTL